MSAENSYANNIGVILLAAGESSRLGTPKQMLLFEGQTLLQHSLQAAIGCNAQPVVVVLGAHADSIKTEIKSEPIHVLINSEWQEGLASSIRYGINSLLRINQSVDGAVIMLCDQPYVSSSLLINLMMIYKQTGKLIVACNYGNTFGPPAFFHKSMFPALLELRGNVGAKSLLSEHANHMELILFPEGNTDIDSEADYQNLSTDNREHDTRLI